MPFKFSVVCDLFEDLETRQRDFLPRTKRQNDQEVNSIVQSWFRKDRRAIDAPDTDQVALLSTLLPHCRRERSHGMQEDRLKHLLPRLLKLGSRRARLIQEWKPEQDFAKVVHDVQKPTDAGLPHAIVHVEDVDKVMHSLSGLSKWSSDDVRDRSPQFTRSDLLGPIIAKLRARELKWFIRLVMKQIDNTIQDPGPILRSFNHLLPGLMRLHADFNFAIQILQSPEVAQFGTDLNQEQKTTLRQLVARHLRPRIGVKIVQPKFVKARSIKNCLDVIGQGTWSIQEKLDGEYCQVHVELSKGQDCIKIFSKSGRDSTVDRRKVQPWLVQALKIDQDDCKFQSNCVLEGELVVWSSETKTIQEFEKIRQHISRGGSFAGKENHFHPQDNEHLMVFFYDLLVLDDEPVIFEKYHKRRERLSALLQHLPGHVQRLDWHSFNFSKMSRAKAEKTLDRLMAKAIANRCEGLILKSCDAPYFNFDSWSQDGFKQCVVKLKKDYIPGLGDTEDFAIVGACFYAGEYPLYMTSEKLVWTHFSIACLENKEEVIKRNAKPVYRVMGTVGPNSIPLRFVRQLCVEGQFRAIPYEHHEHETPFEVRFPNKDRHITVIFNEPFFVEVLGSGFEKQASGSQYMLRHARVIKIRNELDRSLEDIVSLEELQAHAKAATSIPEDQKTEERIWRERLREASKPKGRTFVDTSSPFIESNSQTTTTPQTTPLRSGHMVPPLVRVDTSELTSDELDSRRASTNINAHTNKVTKMLLELPTPPASSLPIERRMTNYRYTNTRTQNTEERKRKRADDDVATSQSTKRSRSSEPSPSYDARAQPDVSRRPVQSSSPTRARTLPLADITNISHDSDLSISNRQQERKGRAHPPSAKENAVPLGLEPTTTPRSGGTIANDRHKHNVPQTVLDDDQHEILFHAIPSNAQDDTSSQTLDYGDQPKCFASSDTVQAFRSSPPPCPSSVHANRPLNLHPLPIQPQTTHGIAMRDNPLRDSIVFLSPCVSAYPYLTEDLLPVLSPHETITDLTYWSRHVIETDSLGPLVSESQAFPGLQKAVLFESRRNNATSKMLASLMELRLVADETIELWDWRVAEAVVEYFEKTNTAKGKQHTLITKPPEDSLRAALIKHFKGLIKYDETKKTNILETKDRAVLVDRYIEKTLRGE